MNVLITERKLLLASLITFSYHMFIFPMAFVGEISNDDIPYFYQ